MNASNPITSDETLERALLTLEIENAAAEYELNKRLMPIREAFELYDARCAAAQAEYDAKVKSTDVTVNGAHIVLNARDLPGLTFQSGTLQDFVNELVACCDDILEARRDPEENYLAVIEAFYGARLQDGKCAYTGDPAELTNLLRRVAHYARVDAFYKQPLVIGGREFIAG